MQSLEHTQTNFLRYITFVIGTLVLIVFPFSAFAQSDLFTTGETIAEGILSIAQTATNIAFIAIIFSFFWGLAKFIWGGAEDKKQGRNIMIWGIVALFVASSIWGIVFLLRTTFGVGNNQHGLSPIVI